MPVKQSKSSSKEKTADEFSRYTRLPLHSKEKENMKSLSSDDSPGKSPNRKSPIMSKKSNSSSSTDSMQGLAGSPKRRSLKDVQNQNNGFEEMENSDTDMEMEFTDDVIVNHVQRQHSSPKYRQESANLKYRKSDQPKGQFQKTEPSIKAPLNTNLRISIIILSILVCLVLIICYLFIFVSQHSSASSMNEQFNASTLVNSLKAEFQDQPVLTFRIIQSALKKIQKTEPEAPAFILLLATNGSENVCNKFARRLVDLLSVSECSSQIYGKNYKVTNTNSAKMEIDKVIEKTFQKNRDQLGSVLIEDLDQIPGRAAVMLHKYSDHENAPFKKAVFVMTVNYNKAISDISESKDWDKAANDHLLSVWTDIGVDQVTPLLARLTVSVAVITN